MKNVYKDLKEYTTKTINYAEKNDTIKLPRKLMIC